MPISFDINRSTIVGYYTLEVNQIQTQFSNIFQYMSNQNTSTIQDMQNRFSTIYNLMLPPPPIYTTFNMQGTATRNGYVIKYNANGSIAWMAQIGGSGAVIMGQSTTDSAGNIYTIVIPQESRFTVYNADKTIYKNVTSALGNYIIKYNSNGVAQWLSAFTSPSYKIMTDSAGNIYIGTLINSGLTIYNSDDTVSSTLPGASTNFYVDAIVFSYNQNGFGGWYGRINDNTLGTADIGIDSYNNIYMSTNILANNMYHIIFNKYDNNGLLLWSIQFNNSGEGQRGSIASSLIPDKSGNIYLSVSLRKSPIPIKNANGTTYATMNGDLLIKYDTNGMIQSITNNAILSIHITIDGNMNKLSRDPIRTLLYNSSNDLVWSYSINNDSVAADNTGNYYILGRNNPPYSLNNQDNTLFKTISDSSLYGYIIKTDISGNIKSYTLLSTYGTVANSTDNSGNIITVGYVDGSSLVIYPFQTQ